MLAKVRAGLRSKRAKSVFTAIPMEAANVRIAAGLVDSMPPASPPPARWRKKPDPIRRVCDPSMRLGKNAGCISGLSLEFLNAGANLARV
jgi:hypothetical protein